MYQNIRCLVSENTQYKMKYLRDYTKANKVILINLTETWLNKNIQGDAKIEGYAEYRSDRIGAKQGGTVIYTLEDLECDVLERHSRGNCELIAVNIKSLNTINMVVYRPPGTNEENFSYILEKIEGILEGMPAPEPTVIISGDFNFPFINWKLNQEGGCLSEIIPYNNASDADKMQFERLDKLTKDYNLIQTVQGPTREDKRSRSSIDLIFTNDITIFNEIDIIKTDEVSDRHR